MGGTGPWKTLDEKRIPASIDAIIHLAGIAHDTGGKFREKEYFEVNLGLTKKIFESFLQSDARKSFFSVQ
jgi:nucleoside-diphosphate-sugar epimerase